MRDDVQAVFMDQFRPSKAANARLVRSLQRTAGEIRMSWHPLGFIHADLWEDAGTTYRLHVWPAYDRRPKTPNWPIHDHVYSLISYVICGEVRNRLFTMRRVDSGASQSLFEVLYDAAGSSLRVTEGGYRVEVATESVIRPCEYYTVPSGVFHQSVADIGCVTATIVRTYGRVSGANPRVVGSIEDSTRKLVYERQIVEEKEKRDRFTEIMRAVMDGCC